MPKKEVRPATHLSITCAAVVHIGLQVHAVVGCLAECLSVRALALSILTDYAARALLIEVSHCRIDKHPSCTYLRITFAAKV